MALIGLLAIILVLTGSVAGTTPKSPVLGVLSPVLIMVFLTWYLIVLVTNRNEIIAALAAILLAQGREKPSRASFLLTIAVYSILLIVSILFLSSGLAQRILRSLREAFITSITGTVPTSPPPELNPISRAFQSIPMVYFGILLFAAIFAVSSFIILSGLYLAIRNRNAMIEELEEQLELKQEAAEVVQEAIVNLKGTRKYHEIILQCYERMCRILSDTGLAIGSSETAREFAESISAKLRIGSEAVRGLTFLFEEARYSDHQINEEKRIMAVTHLESLQRALSANVGQKS